MRDSPPPFHGGGGHGSGSSFQFNGMVAIWIIIGVNAVIHFSQIAAGRIDYTHALTLEGLKAGKIHLLLTYQFLHAPGLFHLLCNMLGLYFIGSAVVRILGVKQLLAAYFLGGIVGGLIEVALQPVIGVYATLVGASGSVSALVGLWAMATPNLRINVLLMFVIPINCRVFTLGFWWLIINVGLGVASIFFNLPPIGWFAHAGGTLLGMIQGYIFRPGRSPRPKKTRTAAPRSDGPKIVAGDFGQGSEPAYNAVLDKINREGIASLTEEEKRILSDAADRGRD